MKSDWKSIQIIADPLNGFPASACFIGEIIGPDSTPPSRFSVKPLVALYLSDYFGFENSCFVAYWQELEQTFQIALAITY